MSTFRGKERKGGRGEKLRLSASYNNFRISLIAPYLRISGAGARGKQEGKGGKGRWERRPTSVSSNKEPSVWSFPTVSRAQRGRGKKKRKEGEGGRRVRAGCRSTRVIEICVRLTLPDHAETASRAKGGKKKKRKKGEREKREIQPRPLPSHRFGGPRSASPSSRR